MPNAPLFYVNLSPERQHGGTEMVNIVPCRLGPNGEMDPKILFYDLAVGDMDVDVLHLTTNAGMNNCIPPDEGGDTKSAPYTWCPPALQVVLHPSGSWGQGEGVDYPRLADMRMQYNTMTFRQTAKSALDFFDRRRKRCRNVIAARGAASTSQPVNERMMNFRIRGTSGHRTFSD
jgi:hypothetical protein